MSGTPPQVPILHDPEDQQLALYYVETLRIRGNAEKGGVSSDGQCPCCGELLEPYQCTCPRVEGQRREAVGTDLGLDRWLGDLSQAEEDARPRS